MLGTIGQLLLLVAFVACALSGIAFFLSARGARDVPHYVRVGRWSWGAMLAALVAASGVLFYLLLNHQFQYAYVYQHSSRSLPFKYVFSAFWGGQEGSFLLWILFAGVVGLSLIKWAKEYETPVMSVVALCQLFMISMVVGLQFGPLAIGSSPFSTLAEAFPGAPVFQQNPGFVPADGQGLNDLLQNPWMVIHPPTLFVGFALMIVPFAFAIAALWKKKYTEWVRPALPWALLSALVLGIGIAMGGYWAYVTLNFGGYWAWDPVENSSLVPWMVGVAALHTMIAQKKSGASQKASIFLSILAFMLVVYSTFLTRSGILGSTSVHSFVDLGLNNQLLVWIVVMGAVGFGLFAYRYRDLPMPERKPRVLSREFMIFSGAMLLCATAAVIILGTSAPIFGRLFREAPSGVPVEFYNKWTLPLALGFVFLAGLGQLFWWNKMSVENLNRVIIKPLGLAVASTVAVLFFTPFVEETGRAGAPASEAPGMAQAGFMGGMEHLWASYGQGFLLLLLVFAAFFALYGNGLVLWRVGRGNPKMVGGATAHVGFALVILGVIASSGFSDPIAPHSTARTADGRTVPRENFILASGETRFVDGYRVTYAGREENERGRGQYVLNFEQPESGRTFTLKPVAYQGGEQWFLHPDLKIFVEKDVYASVTPREATGVEGNEGEMTLAQGDSTVIGNGRFAIRFKGYDTRVDSTMLPEGADIPVGAALNVTNTETGEMRQARPVYLIMNDRTERFLPARFEDWGLTLTFSSMNVDSGEATFTVEGADVMPDDWLVVQAYEKPFIGVLWIGIILLSGGFLIALVRRIRDVSFWRTRQAAA